MRVRAGEAFSLEELAAYYYEPQGYNITEPSARERVSVAMGESIPDVHSIADLSAGPAMIPRYLASLTGATLILGDYAPGYELEGPILETIASITFVDLFVCTETLEHLDDPEANLRAIRPKCANLLVSTPIDQPIETAGGGHYWVWSRSDVEQMLVETGFMPQAFVELDMTLGWMPGYVKFGIWVCR